MYFYCEFLLYSFTSSSGRENPHSADYLNSRIDACVYQQQFYELFLSPCRKILHTIMRFTKRWTSLHPRLWTTEPFRRFPFHTQSRYHHPLPVNLLTGGMCQTGGFEHSTTFPVFSRPVTTCFKRVAGIKFRNQWSRSDKTLNIPSLYRYVKRFRKWSHSVLFMFYTALEPGLDFLFHEVVTFPTSCLYYESLERG